MNDVVLSVDIGTTSLKAGLITAEGEVVSFCSVPIENPHDRFVAFSWYSTLLKAVKSFDAKAKIIGVAVSGNGPTLVTDFGFTFRWNERNSPSLPPASDGSIFLPKLITFKNNFPHEYKKARKIFSGPEYLIYVLTGKEVTILPEERFLSAYWNKKQCKACKIDYKKLPPFAKTCLNCGQLNQSFIKEAREVSEGSLSFLSVCSVFSCGPDFIAALIGTNTLHPGKLCDRCGSSEGLNFCSDKIIKGDKIRTLPSVITGLWNASVLIPDSSLMTDEQRLEAVADGIDILRKAALDNKIEFPSQMAVTGGQTNDVLLLKEKSERLNMKIFHPFSHCELLGDACVAFKGLGVYKDLPEAAAHIVRAI